MFNFSQYQHQLDEIIAEKFISYLAVFGSTARGDNRPDSDIDLLVEFNQPVGMFHVAGTQIKLEKLFHKKVDLVTKKGLNKYLRPYIVPDLKVLYEEKS